MIDYAKFIDEVCEFMTVRANQKERENRKGVCDHEVIGFVHGVRWCVSVIKNNKNLLEYVNKENERNEKN